MSVPCLESAAVVETKQVGEREFLSKFRTPKIAAEVKPGQFVMVSFPDTIDPLLPRAYSVCDVDGDCLKLFYAAVGKGSKRLSRLSRGEIVRLNGPLGMGFPMPVPGENIWIVVGGSGAALLPILIKMSKKNGATMKIFYGAKTKEHICNELVEALNATEADSINYATDDGTFGYHGTVVQLMKNKMPYPSTGKGAIPSKIFGCGPTPMLIALQQGFGTAILTYLSVETPMACGMGFCQGCPVKISAESDDVRAGADYFLACKDGPVFESQLIEFESARNKT